MAKLKLQKVKSANILRLGYDSLTRVMVIEFKNKRGMLYDFQRVPSYHFARILNAGSIGGYFATHIKHKYQFTTRRSNEQ